MNAKYAGKRVPWIHRLTLPPRLSALAMALSVTAGAQDVSFMAVVKGQHFHQSGAHYVALSESGDSEADQPLVFEAFAEGVAGDSLISGMLAIPGGSMMALGREEPGDSGLRSQFTSGELIDLNASCPSGSYTISLVTKNDGARTATILLSGDAYPPVPRVSNYTALQSAASGGAVTVQWTTFTGGTAGDFILLAVHAEDGELLYETDSPGSPGALNGAATQVEIPAGILESGQHYKAELMFVKVTAMSTAYTPLIAGYFKRVGFDIYTAPAPGAVLGAALESIIPADHRGDVPRDSGVTFRFSRAMNPAFHAVNWSGPGINPASFSYEWREGDKVLLCRYGTALPASSEIKWTLNLAGFRDAANFPLTGSRTGSFYTGSGNPESPPDVDGYYVLKMQGFRQTGASPVSTGMFGLDAVVEMSAFNRLKAPAQLSVAANGSSGLLIFRDDEPAARTENSFASKADLDRFFPNGNFTFGFSTLADGDKTLTLSLGASDDYPPAPVVTNLGALQLVDPSAPLTVTWNALSGWSPSVSAGSGVIEMKIENDLGMEVFYLDNEDLSSSSQGIIPAGTLWPGRTYRASLTFIRVKDVNGGYGASGGAAGFGSITDFSLTTAGRPVLPGIEIAPAGQNISLTMSGGEPWRRYVLEASADLLRWHPMQDVWMWENGLQQFPDEDARYLKARHYRLRDTAAGDEQIVRHVTVQGTVWTNSSRTQPVAGAVVGTSLDGSTAVTDTSGRFFLETDTSAANGTLQYTIQVTAGVASRSFGPWNWGDQPRGQHFEMQ